MKNCLSPTLKNYPRVLVLLALALSLSCTGHLTAQATDSEDVVEMSPFEVDSSSDNGYIASRSLAGTRLASDLKNIAAQVQVMTPEFLEDIAAVTLDEANLYSLNVEGLSEYTPNAQNDGGAGVEDLQGAQRVRGLANAGNTRDFFATYSQQDAYNSERFTYASGPNAILFGLGSPGGIIDNSLIRARFKDANKVAIRADSWEGYRGSFDVNRVLIPKVLAVRAAAVYDHGESWRKPSRDRKRRQFYTATFRPFESTNIRASFENIRREASIPRNTLLKDHVTPYLAWRDERMTMLGINDPFDLRLFNTNAAGMMPGEPSLNSPSGIPSPFTGFGGITLYNTGIIAADTPAESILARYTGTSQSRGPQQLPGVHSFDNRARSLTDESIFPYDIAVGGLTTDNHEESTIGNITIEQKLAKNLFVEAAFSQEEITGVFTDPLRGLDQRLRIDVNRYAPGTDVPNPNRGRYYVESWGRSRYRDAERESSRLTGSYVFDFGEHDGWTKWLGKHSLAGLLSKTDSTSRIQSNRALLFAGDETVPGINLTNQGQHRIFYRYYLDDPGSIGGTSYADTNVHPAELRNANVGVASGVSLGVLSPEEQQYVWAQGVATNSETLGQMFALQSEFLDGRVIATYGRRSDDFLTSRANTPRLGGNSWNRNRFGPVSDVAIPNFDNPEVDATSTNDTKGVVVFPLKWLSLHYNESKNSTVGNADLDPFGDFTPPSSGTGKDYGFSLALMEDKLFFKANWFENNQTNNRSNEFSSLGLRVRTTEIQVNELAAVYPGVGFNPTTTWDVENQLLGVFSDLASKGEEYSLTANPVSGWRVRISAATIDSVETNIGNTFIRYINERRPEWQKFGAYAVDETAPFPPDAGQETIAAFVERQVDRTVELIRLSEGRSNDSVPKWRVNLVTSYDFQSGLLKNFGIGGAYRWRDKAVIGYPLVTINGEEIQDIENPFFNDGTRDVDAWISYRTTLFDVKTKFQLNVRNLFDDRDLIPQAALTTGERSLYTVKPPRQFIFSANFAF